MRAVVQVVPRPELRYVDIKGFSDDQRLGASRAYTSTLQGVRTLRSFWRGGEARDGQMNREYLTAMVGRRAVLRTCGPGPAATQVRISHVRECEERITRSLPTPSVRVVALQDLQI